MSLAEYTAKMMETVPRYKVAAGLVRKSYLYDADRRLGGAVYTFENATAAQTCLSQEFVQRVRARYGTPEISRFETPIAIDNERGTVTELSAPA